MKAKCLYKIGDTVNVMDSEKPMLVTGYVLDDSGYFEDYELVPKDSIMYCTETAITGLVEHGEHGERNNVNNNVNHALEAELEKVVDCFLEAEKVILNEPYANSIKVDLVFNLKNGVDVKITVGRGLGNE